MLLRLAAPAGAFSGTQSGSLFERPSVVICTHSPVATLPTQRFHPGPVTPSCSGAAPMFDCSGPRLNATYLPSGDQST